MTTTSWREELSWAAGFFDGEGWTGAAQRPKAKRSDRRARIHITQAYDRRVLDRFQAAVGIGRIHGPYPQPRGGDKWTYIATDYQHVQAVIAMLWTFLSPVKREQAKVALAKVVEDARNGPGHGSTWTRCRRGHDLTDPNNVLKYVQRGWMSRRCRACGAARQAKVRRKAMLASALLEAV